MTRQPSSPIDISPTLKMYMEFIELSKRNYENFLKSAPVRANGMDGKKAEVENITSPNDAALVKLARIGEGNLQAFRAKPGGVLAILRRALGAVPQSSGADLAVPLIDRVGRTAVCVPEQVCERDYLLEAGKLAGSVGERARQPYAGLSDAALGRRRVLVRSRPGCF